MLPGNRAGRHSSSHPAKVTDLRDTLVTGLRRELQAFDRGQEALVAGRHEQLRRGRRLLIARDYELGSLCNRIVVTVGDFPPSTSMIACAAMSGQ